MAQSAVTVRIDSELKTQFDALCEQFGMSVRQVRWTCLCSKEMLQS